MIQSDRESILEEEWLLVRHSGEIPEVALHASFHYLGDDAEGPHLVLTQEEVAFLQQAVMARYEEIILRDLEPANRDLALFRGIRRANHNWYRYARFCERIPCGVDVLQTQAAQALAGYLRVEQQEVLAGARKPSINCTAEALLTFVLALELDPASLPQGWEALCEQLAL
ncbi:MAG: hypothetical protein PHI97_09315 [Desulfobulbus sp.]|nr:hypothetical protein [Desulfobulbus sp.]